MGSYNQLVNMELLLWVMFGVFTTSVFTVPAPEAQYQQPQSSSYGEQGCRTVYENKCIETSEQKCETTYQDVCVTVNEQQCRANNKQECIDLERQQCRQTTEEVCGETEVAECSSQSITVEGLECSGGIERVCSTA